MKQLLILLTASVVAHQVNAQTVPPARKLPYDKWERASINLQGEGDFRNYFYTGSFIYLKDHGRHYLVTAAHVLRDPKKTEENIRIVRAFPQEDSNRLEGVPFWRMRLIRRYDTPRIPIDDMINVIYPQVDDSCRIFTWSEKLDLAVISLDYNSSQRRFRRLLDKLGYYPITLNDFNFTGRYEVGSEIVCVGFPNPSKISKSYSPFEGNYRNIPIFSFGRIASSSKWLAEFWIDVSVYPGNSGGPVIQDNKVVGIVSSQSHIALDSAGTPASVDYRVRIPFANAVKIGPLKKLLAELQYIEHNNHCTLKN